MEVAAINSLIEELIIKVAQLSAEANDTKRLRTLKRRAEAALHLGVHGRTNQFEVDRQLEGLQEKFRVLNRDELAESLHYRISELQDFPNSWHPEILSLLLQLSDRPAELTENKLPQVPSLSNHTPNRPLLWADLDAHGAAFSDEEIWNDVDFGSDSSDDDLESEKASGSLHEFSLQTLSAGEVDYKIPEEVYLQGEDEGLLTSIEKAQFWKLDNFQRADNVSVHITELQLARETIFMLQALPTSVFRHAGGRIDLDRSYALTHASHLGVCSLLASFAQTGTKINALRHFANTTQRMAYMQTFSRGIEDFLHEFDSALCEIQRRYLSPGSAISILQLHEEVTQASHQLLLLSELVADLEAKSIDRPMYCLDLLFDLVCMTEALGDESSSKTLGKFFLSCVKTYAHSIQLWMEHGQIDPYDTAFFVKAKNNDGDLRTIWSDWFHIDEGFERQNIPKFLQSCIQRVFTTGKSKVFLRHLHALTDDIEAGSAEPLFDEVFSEPFLSPLPFSVRLETAFDRLVDLHHSASAGLLRIELESQCGLWRSFVALKQVYLGEDISPLSIIDAKVFELIDRGRAWDDRFLLTEVARSAFSVLPHMDVSRIVVRSQVGGLFSYDSPNLNRTVIILEKISIDYTLPWAIANIVPRSAIRIYQRISTFLMQIRRSRYSLVKQRLREGRHFLVDGRNRSLVNSLHHNLTWFLDVLYSHFAYIAISTSTDAFHQALHDAQDVDTIIAAHDFYISSLEEQCLLSENLKPVHQAVIDIMDLAINMVDLQIVHAAEGETPGPSNMSVSKQQRRQRNSDTGSGSDSDSESDDGFEYEQTLTISFNETSYDTQLRNLKSRFENLVVFVADHLKDVARANGHSSWNILAERIEWRQR
ncbi:hypothetical protein PDE_09878 [Penicillium oxalicum 114-2]|uniref:Spindle pole body component n=1 Tax=Penicillium oxalicum (strain 114-2 / CGMCC 5302) TaxID=933388 RepID=S7ZWU8_PENO1|nr:hypothetical protein PDE_09878 [Penicillium oxalicum 114-2]